MAKKNYYDQLGVSKDATEKDIKAAYRKSVMMYHPDRFATKPEAERKTAEDNFKEVNHAYDVLSNPEKKENYDSYGSEDGPKYNTGGGAGGFGGGFSGGGFGGFEDIFSQFFGGAAGGGSRQGGGRTSPNNMPIDGDDISMKLDITFDEAIHGCEKVIKVYRTEKCPDCKGLGASDASKISDCPVCHGTGTVTVTQNTIFGKQIVRTKCSNCAGKGKIVTEKCGTCKGVGVIKKERTIPVTIPAGTDNNQTITYYNEGEAGVNGGSNGRLIIIISVKSHELFERDGTDLYVDIPITISDAVIGGKISVPTTSKTISLTIPAGTQSGTKFRVKGYGVKYLKKEMKGDLYVTVDVEIPQKLGNKQVKLLEEFESSLVGKQYDKKKSFLAKWINKA